MAQLKKIRLIFLIWWVSDIKPIPGRIKREIWNKRILLFWHRLWIRKDEFHPSLDMDGAAMLQMDKDEMKKYLKDLNHRREIAHERDLERRPVVGET